MIAKFKVTFIQIKVDDFSFGSLDRRKVVKKINNTPRFKIDFRDQIQSNFDDMINIDFRKVPKVIKDNKFIITVEVPETDWTIDDIKKTMIGIEQVVIQTKVDRNNIGNAFIETYIEVA